MMLATIYLMFTAKPISLRRLSAFFVSTLILTAPVLAILRVQFVEKDALLIAASLTLLVWSIPLLQAIRHFARRGALWEGQRASTCVQWTYALVTTMAAILATSTIVERTGHLHLGELAKLVPIAGIAAAVLLAGFCVWGRSDGAHAVRRENLEHAAIWPYRRNDGHHRHIRRIRRYSVRLSKN